MTRKKKLKTVVVLPGFNAEKTLEKTIKDIPKDYVDEIVLVDDASEDKTYEIAGKLGLVVKRHEENKGYGANQKSCYDIALRLEADIIVMLHPDYQYDPKLIKHFIQLIKDEYFDVMLGSRIRSRNECLKAGMPLYKYVANRFLTIIENIVSGYNLSEWHTGMRAYKGEVLRNIDFKANSDDFIFDTQMLFKIIEKGYKIGEISVPVKYFSEASSINFKRSLKYGLQTLWISLNYFLVNLLEKVLPKS